MPLGKITTDWKELPTADKVAREMGANLPALQYYTRTRGKVFQATKNTLDGDFLVSTDRDFQSAVPDGVKYKLFKNGTAQPVGFVTQDASNNLKLYDALGEQVAASAAPDQVSFGGLNYEKVGSQGTSVVYARLDRAALQATREGSRLADSDLGVYEGSMRKGPIPSGSTGSDGIKFESQGSMWVVKITISMAQANNMDNTLSPASYETRDPGAKRIYLNFNMLVSRH